MENTYKVNEEAVKKIAERVYDNGSTVINRNDLEEMFPSLKEIEGEKIRKELLDFIHYIRYNQEGIPKQFIERSSNYIAWLEKQGEQKSTADNFESALKHIMEEAIECGDTHNLKADAEMLMRLVQKPSEWSETDKLKMETIINVISNQRGSAIFEGFLPEELINWLNSLKDRFVPQPKHEWSEEDEKMFNEMVKYCKFSISYDGEGSESAEKWKKRLNWLKSLRPRSYWKPSKEQMDALCFVKKAKILDPDERESLDNLYRQLKKLREE